MLYLNSVDSRVSQITPKSSDKAVHLSLDLGVIWDTLIDSDAIHKEAKNIRKKTMSDFPHSFGNLFLDSEGLVEDAILLGAPVPASSSEWKQFSRVVAGRIVNGYCR